MTYLDPQYLANLNLESIFFSTWVNFLSFYTSNVGHKKSISLYGSVYYKEYFKFHFSHWSLLSIQTSKYLLGVTQVAHTQQFGATLPIWAWAQIQETGPHKFLSHQPRKWLQKLTVSCWVQTQLFNSAKENRGMKLFLKHISRGEQYLSLCFCFCFFKDWKIS